MDQDEPGRNSPQSGGQRPVSTVRSYSRLRSYTGHGNLTYGEAYSAQDAQLHLGGRFLALLAEMLQTLVAGLLVLQDEATL